MTGRYKAAERVLAKGEYVPAGDCVQLPLLEGEHVVSVGVGPDGSGAKDRNTSRRLAGIEHTLDAHGHT
jgi:hypothetical protein